MGNNVLLQGPSCGIQLDPSGKSWLAGKEVFMVSGLQTMAASQCLLSTTSWSCNWAILFRNSSCSFASVTDAGEECLKGVREGAWYCCWGYMGNGESKGTGDS